MCGVEGLLSVWCRRLVECVVSKACRVYGVDGL